MKTAVILWNPSRGLWDPEDSTGRLWGIAAIGRHSQTISRNNHCVFGCGHIWPRCPEGGWCGKKLAKSQTCGVPAAQPPPSRGRASVSCQTMEVISDDRSHVSPGVRKQQARQVGIKGKRRRGWGSVPGSSGRGRGALGCCGVPAGVGVWRAHAWPCPEPCPGSSSNPEARLASESPTRVSQDVIG